MKKAPSLSKEELIEQGLVKNIKKISKLDFVDEQNKKRFKDGSTVYSKSLKCYVQLKSFDPASAKYKSRLYAPTDDLETFVVKC